MEFKLSDQIFTYFCFEMEDILAIDFGTTNSTACVYKDGKRTQLWNNQASGEYYFPSFIIMFRNSAFVVCTLFSAYAHPPEHSVTIVLSNQFCETDGICCVNLFI